MSDAIDLGDDGRAAVTVGAESVTVDLFLARDRLLDYHEANKQKGREEYHRGLVEVAEGLGLPRLTFKQANRFALAVYEACDEAKKNGAAPAESPASTTSTPAG